MSVRLVTWVLIFCTGYPGFAHAMCSRDCALVLKSSHYAQMGGARGKLQRQSFFDAIRAEMRRRSDRARALIAHASSVPQYDLVVVGAGPAGATAQAAFLKNRPSARVLTLERSAFVSTVFDRHQDFYRMTTQSGSGLELNRIPGAPLQPEMLSDSLYPHPRDVADVLWATHYESGGELVFGSWPLHITRTAAPDGHRYGIDLSSGGRVSAKRVIFATGIGSSPDLDALVAQALVAREHGQDPLAPFAGKRVALVGTGVVSWNLAEFLLGLNPIVPVAATRAPVHLIWVGMGPTARAKMSAPLRARYHELLDRWAEWGIEERPAFSGTQDADVTLHATGPVKNSALDAIQALWGAPLSWEPVFPEQGAPTVIGRQAWNTQGQPEEIYIAGIAGGLEQVSASELAHSQSQNPSALEILLPRVERLAQQLAAPLERRVFDLSTDQVQRMVEGVVAHYLPSKMPQILLLAGIPGSGKSTLMENWIQNHLAGEPEPLIIDPDRLRFLLPGYQELLRANSAYAAIASHRAATLQFQIPLVRASFERSLNFVVDGTLRDYRVTARVLSHLKQAHPQYRVTLLRVRTPYPVALARLRNRFAQTGRRVPVETEEDLRLWDSQIDLSMQVLRPLVDDYQEMGN